MRLNAIIEKTARFIADQGAQMEILIKAKQSNNPQFEFLNMNGRCYAYYKFLVEAIKAGKYPERKVISVSSQTKDTEKKSKVDTGRTENNPSTIPEPIIRPVLTYVPSEDCAYTQLISKIQGKPISEIQAATPKLAPLDVDKASDLKKPTIEFKNKSNSVEVKQISSALLLAQCYNSDTDSEEDAKPEKSTAESTAKVTTTNGNRSSLTSSNLERLNVPVPPQEIRVIVDKTAAYVAKNGRDFEDILKTKCDPRFSFLNPTDAYHRYYIFKVTGSVYIPATSSVSAVQKEHDVQSETKTPTVIQPVSFTIKALKEGANADIPLKPTDVKLDDSADEEEPDDSISIADLLEREERKESIRVRDRAREDTQTNVSKEKQLQQERKRKAMEFLMKIKKNGLGNSTTSEPTQTQSIENTKIPPKVDRFKEASPKPVRSRRRLVQSVTA